jgi:hypothetical protein
MTIELRIVEGMLALYTASEWKKRGPGTEQQFPPQRPWRNTLLSKKEVQASSAKKVLAGGMALGPADNVI